MLSDKNPKKQDFVSYRLLPFLIGLGVYLVLMLIYGILSFIAAALSAIASYTSLAYNADPFVSLTGLFISTPFWIAIFVINLAFLILTTWLIGRWIQEKYDNYQAKRDTNLNISGNFDKQNYKNQQQEAEWEKEWQMMKQQEHSSKKNQDQKVKHSQEPSQNKGQPKNNK